MIDFKVHGLSGLVAGLSELQGAKLRNTTRDVLAESARRVVVPMMKGEVPTGKDSPWRRPTDAHPSIGKKGGPMARKVTARTIRRRRGEMVAISVASRTWYDHFVARGTRPHVISARARAEGRRVALRIDDGVYRYSVHHPGARSNDYVRRTSARVRSGNQLPEALAGALTRKFHAATRSP